MLNVAVSTLGCRANQLESSILEEELENNGFNMVEVGKQADIIIINSCTVTQKSDSKSRYAIRQAKRLNPEAKIIVTGCYAQTAPDEIASIDGVFLVAGNAEKQELVNILLEISNNSEYKKIMVSDIKEENSFRDKKVISASGRTRATIKVQDGCNFCCSYCIIPQARGKSRSNSLENIIEQVKFVINKGYQEIVLSGIHLGQWGVDLKPKNELNGLLKELEKIKELKRLRLSSIDPLELSENLVETIINSEKICKHLHISLQSADNDILKAMNRRYTVEKYSDIIYKLHDNIPELAIGSDIITGFPGETEDQFINTYKNLEILPISYLHVFTYSDRKNTPASKMSGKISHEVKKQRTTELNKLAKIKNLEFRRRFLDSELEILVEYARDKSTGMLKGLSSNYIPVLIEGTDELKNNLVVARINHVYDNLTIGELV